MIIFAVLAISARVCYGQWEERPPQLRWEWEQRRYCDPTTGVIPADAYRRDAEYARRLAQDYYAKAPRTASVIVQPIGPTNVAGRTRAFAIDRRASNVFMCGGVTGGVWRSIDRGQSWVRMSSPTALPHVSCIVQSIRRPDTWYIGTGEGLSTTERRTSKYLRTIGTGSGIFCSTDNGTTWQQISPQPMAQPNTLPAEAWQIIWRLAVQHQSATETLYAACYGGIYAWDGSRWHLEIGDTTRPAFCTEIISRGDKLYAAIGATDEGMRPEQYGIFMRVGDGSWQNITPTNFPLMRRIVLAASSDGNILYVFGQAPRSWSQRYSSFSSIHTLWRYTAAAQRWEDCSAWIQLLARSQYPLETLGGYCMALAVHPTNPAIVFIGGTDAYSSHDGCGTSAYHLGGYPYTVSDGTLHPDVHTFEFDPLNPNRLYAATDGGIYATDAPLAQQETYWHALNTGLTTTQAYHVALDRASSDRFVIAGFQDNSNWYTLSPTYGVPWTFAGGGDGCRVLVGKGRQLVFATSQFGNVYALSAVSSTPQYRILPQPPQRGTTFVTEIAYDTSSSLLVLALGNALYRLRIDANTADAAWTLAATLPVASPITVIALHQLDALVGTADGALFRADILSGNVEQIEAPLPAGSYVAAIDWDEVDRQRIIVTLSNYTVPSIFASWDGGRTWQSVGGSLDEEEYGWGPSVRVVRTLYRDGKRIYIAGTSIGAFITDSLHSATRWQPLGLSTIGSLPVEAVETRSGDGWTVIGTHGGGIFTCTLDPHSIGTENSPTPTDFVVEHCLPHPVTDHAIIEVHVPRPGGIIHLAVFDILGHLLVERLSPVLTGGNNSIVLSPAEIRLLPTGTYFYRVRWEDRQAMGVFIRTHP